MTFDEKIEKRIEEWRSDFEKVFKRPDGVVWKDGEYFAESRTNARDLLYFCAQRDGFYAGRATLVLTLPQFDEFDMPEAAEAIDKACKVLADQGIFTLTEWVD